MLSKIAETRPKPSVVVADALGRTSTGISEADRTSASKKRLPRAAPGTSFQLSGRKAVPASNVNHNAAASNGKSSARDPRMALAARFVHAAAARAVTTIPIRQPSTRMGSEALLFAVAQLACCRDATVPKTTRAVAEPMYAGSTASGLVPSIHIIVVVVSPSTLPAPPALAAATMAAR